MSERVESTDCSRTLLRELWAQHGPLLIHQSGGCCDGSAPMCFTVDEFRVGEANVRLGTVDLGDGDIVPVWVSEGEARVWENSTLILDAEPGRAAGFSLEGSSGHRFVSRVRIAGTDGAACPAPQH
ncbi:hypothetical protein TPAU25S_03818 [Tsukamurella paurometabola]|uniref:DUF779 domain-containing protein n=1 Tax=Tsukamurella paurometabola (strain ATCC 8368 / DSM 20162 / CCUG 35730 / CIP 100753 / JCM 10117 / KCTC 9821 / NBRC 16120 / NCIMB 702349 / NCTC 13040) TaxID=521096 RepID=D5UND6_TSUPD|nr:DUF779 domain-containing protein [Tsukamurella paurometabola]ADG80631.1 protein of unknown function DUF779 [Tsukamurella paurometabola DSM 20162]SUP40355.1 Uncharacterized protein conserved in bacteria [Tsukamurella paurometabola]